MNNVSPSTESDTLNGVKHPRFASLLIGHTEAWKIFMNCRLNDKVHHAWIISGPKGIGKATLAWKIAKELMCQRNGNQKNAFDAIELQKKIEALSLSNLFLCRRPYDEKTKRFKKFITIDEVRKLKAFFNMSAIENEWRISIIDSADELNKPASNALLKILEEPPTKSIFLIITSQLERLPSTIRSRCRTLKLKRLNNSEIEEILKIANFNVGKKSANERLILSVIAEGSAGTAMNAMKNDGIKFFIDCMDILLGFPNFDRNKIINLSELIKNQSDKFYLFTSILLIIISRLTLLFTTSQNTNPTEEEKLLIIRIRKRPKIGRTLAILYSELSNSFIACTELNLDISSCIVNAFLKIENNLTDDNYE